MIESACAKTSLVYRSSAAYKIIRVRYRLWEKQETYLCTFFLLSNLGLPSDAITLCTLRRRSDIHDSILQGLLVVSPSDALAVELPLELGVRLRELTKSLLGQVKFLLK